ncbi:MAG TPA: hypothetical protein VMT34_08765 [Aggregatilineales bacterium]|nr:hypothetical protein [Aggregatilineales bacterium]
MNTSQFMKNVPLITKSQLPKALQSFKQTLLPWLVQLYYDDRYLHYEVAKLPEKYGANRIEIGLHFESRDHGLNNALLRGFDRYLLEVRDAVGEDWWAEPWIRGWTKIYTTIQYQTIDQALLEETGMQLAKAMVVLQPIYSRLRSQWKG